MRYTVAVSLGCATIISDMIFEIEFTEHCVYTRNKYAQRGILFNHIACYISLNYRMYHRGINYVDIVYSPIKRGIWWGHETFPELLAICEGSIPVTGVLPSQQVNNAQLWCFLCCFNRNMLLDLQLSCRRFDTLCRLCEYVLMTWFCRDCFCVVMYPNNLRELYRSFICKIIFLSHFIIYRSFRMSYDLTETLCSITSVNCRCRWYN